MTKNPWKTLSKETIYESPWIKVREDKVIAPDGSDSIYNVVETKLAVGILAIKNDEVYLVGQYRYPIEQYSWEIIEGGVEEGESALETAKRELREEAGLVADKWTELGHKIHLSNCMSDEVGILFLAEDLKEVDKDPDPTEVLEVKKIRIAEARKLIEDGHITDSLTLIAFSRYCKS